MIASLTLFPSHFNRDNEIDKETLVEYDDALIITAKLMLDDKIGCL